MQDKHDLIYAMLLSRPIGTIVVAVDQNKTDSYTFLNHTYILQHCEYIIDGYNRLSIIQEYLNNEFACKNYYFNELTDAQRFELYSYKIQIQYNLIESKTDRNKIKPIMDATYHDSNYYDYEGGLLESVKQHNVTIDC
jgi:hypothetical protein